MGRRGGSSQGRFPTPPTPLLLVCWQAQGWRRGGDATEPRPLRGRRGLRLSRAPFGTLLHGTRAACAFRMGSTWLPFLSLETRARGRGHPPVRDVHSSADPRGRVEREVARVPSGARWHGGAQRAPWAFARPLAAPRAHVPSALPDRALPAGREAEAAEKLYGLVCSGSFQNAMGSGGRPLCLTVSLGIYEEVSRSQHRVGHLCPLPSLLRG